jgi:hypothetical protein
MVVASSGSKAVVVDVATGREVTKVEAKAAIRGARFSADSKTLILAGGGDKRVIVHSILDKKQREFPTTGDVVWVDVDDASTIVAAAEGSQGVEVFDLKTGMRLQQLPATSASEWKMGLNGDGSRLFAGDG